MEIELALKILGFFKKSDDG